MNALQIFTEIVINAGIAQGFLITILYPLGKRSHSHTLLSLLLIDLSLIVFSTYYLNQLLENETGRPFLVEGPFIFLLGPLLFFYLRNMVFQEVSITRKDAVHFVPFILFFLASIPVYVHGEETSYVDFVRRFIGSPWIFLLVQFSYYLVKARGLIRSHRDIIRQKFSNVEGMDVSW